MSFFPRTGSPCAWFEEEQKEQEEEEQEEQEQNKDSFFDPPLSFAEEWGFRLRYDLMDHAEAAAELAETFEQNPFKLPKAISWHTSLYFEITDPQIWRVLYTRDGYPVIIEREFGKGSIVFSADSYFFSNEAMRKERYPELLTWLVGSHPTIIFDETHFGIRENPGIAALIRKYRLGWFVAGLVLLAGLFVWQNAFSFVPPLSDTRQERIDSGKGVTEGLINLLRRNIASKDILKICFDEWKKSFFTHHRKIPEKAYDQVKTILEAEQTRPLKKRNSVECYNRIAKILKTVNFTLSS